MFNWFKKNPEIKTEPEVSSFAVSIVLVLGPNVINRLYIIDAENEDLARSYAIKDSHKNLPDYQQVSLATVKIHRDMIC